MAEESLGYKEKVKADKILVIGGCRSGKSRFALERASSFPPRKVFVATLENKDDAEMVGRVLLHQKARGEDWICFEEPVRIAELLENTQKEADVFVVDCLTMWITNQIIKGSSDEEIETNVRKLEKVLGKLSVPVILVANEVGLGIVPENYLGRRFRDIAGWTNQWITRACQEVVFVAAGLPLYLKK